MNRNKKKTVDLYKKPHRRLNQVNFMLAALNYSYENWKMILRKILLILTDVCKSFDVFFNILM